MEKEKIINILQKLEQADLEKLKNKIDNLLKQNELLQEVNQN